MAIVFDKVNYKNNLKDINIKINKKKVTGLYGDNVDCFISILNGDLEYSGNINYDKKKIDSSFFKEKPSTIALISSRPNFYTNKVMDEVRFLLTTRKYDISNIDEKVKNYFSLVGLDDVINRDINTLSTSEKYLFNIVLNLLYEPSIIIFKDLFMGLDYNAKKKLKVIINNLKEEKKTIIVSSNDINVIYDMTDEIIIIKNNIIYKSGNTTNVLTSKELIEEGIIEIPHLIKVTSLAKTDKNIKLSYHKDVRDIIKDIYKHV